MLDYGGPCRRTLSDKVCSDAMDTKELTILQRTSECPNMGQFLKYIGYLSSPLNSKGFRTRNIMIMIMMTMCFE